MHSEVVGFFFFVHPLAAACRGQPSRLLVTYVSSWDLHGVRRVMTCITAALIANCIASSRDMLVENTERCP